MGLFTLLRRHRDDRCSPPLRIYGPLLLLRHLIIISYPSLYNIYNIHYTHIYCFHHFRHPHRRRFYKRCSNTNSRPTPLLPPPPPLLPLVSLPLTPCRVTILLRVQPRRALSQCIHLIYAAVYVCMEKLFFNTCIYIIYVYRS